MLYSLPDIKTNKQRKNRVQATGYAHTVCMFVMGSLALCKASALFAQLPKTSLAHQLVSNLATMNSLCAGKHLFSVFIMGKFSNAFKISAGHAIKKCYCD